MALWIVSWGTVAPRWHLLYYAGNELGPEKGCLGYMAVGCMVVVGSDGWDMFETSFE